MVHPYDGSTSLPTQSLPMHHEEMMVGVDYGEWGLQQGQGLGQSQGQEPGYLPDNFHAMDDMMNGGHNGDPNSWGYGDGGMGGQGQGQGHHQGQGQGLAQGQYIHPLNMSIPHHSQPHPSPHLLPSNHIPSTHLLHSQQDMHGNGYYLDQHLHEAAPYSIIAPNAATMGGMYEGGIGSSSMGANSFVGGGIASGGNINIGIGGGIVLSRSAKRKMRKLQEQENELAAAAAATATTATVAAVAPGAMDVTSSSSSSSSSSSVAPPPPRPPQANNYHRTLTLTLNPKSSSLTAT